MPVILTFAKVIKASRLTRIGARVAKCITHFLNSDKNKSEEEEGENIENKITEN